MHAVTFKTYAEVMGRDHSRSCLPGPYALRYAGGRMQGEYATVADAIAEGMPGAAVVTREGAWIQGYIVTCDDNDHLA